MLQHPVFRMIDFIGRIVLLGTLMAALALQYKTSRLQKEVIARQHRIEAALAACQCDPRDQQETRHYHPLYRSYPHETALAQ